MHSRSLVLYRRLLKEAAAFPAEKIGRKIRANVRDAYQIYRISPDGVGDLERVLDQGEAVVRLLRQLRELDEAQFQTVFGGFD
jgi:hypothetical protein